MVDGIVRTRQVALNSVHRYFLWYNSFDEHAAERKGKERMKQARCERRAEEAVGRGCWVVGNTHSRQEKKPKRRQDNLAMHSITRVGVT